MPRRIVLILGHPDPGPTFCRALADTYAKAATLAEHEVRRLNIAAMDIPFLRSAADFDQTPPPAPIQKAQEDIAWAEHIVLIYPLWLGTMPALLKAFLEQVMRPGFAFEQERPDRWPQKRLTGRSARIVVTMGMPALAYRFFYLAHSLKSLERNILRFVGIGPVRETLIGGVGTIDEKRRNAWLYRMADLGRGGR